MVSLLWIACSLSGTNQIKALKLVDLALSNGKVQKKGLNTSKNNDGSSEEATGGSNNSWLSGESISPEDILLNGQGKLLVGDVHAFLIQFAYKGRSTELRRVSCSIGAKLCKQLNSSEVGLLLERLLGRLNEIGKEGKNSSELLNFLQSQLKSARELPIQVSAAADMVMHYLYQQVQAIKHDKANGECFILETSSSSKKRYEMAPCIHCHRGNTPNTSKDKVSVIRGIQDRSIATAGNRSGSNIHRTSQSGASGNRNLPGSDTSSQPTEQAALKREWLPEQVSPFSKGRLDCGKESSTNNEFCLFRQCKRSQTK